MLFVQLNVALFIFNMLPIPPLDGSQGIVCGCSYSGSGVNGPELEQMGFTVISYITYFYFCQYFKSSYYWKQ